MHRSLVSTALLLMLGCAMDGAGYEAARIEGRTAAVHDGAALYALRLWTAPELDSLRRAGIVVDSLAVAPDELRMRRGERLPLERVSIVALSPEGTTVPAAPVVLEIDSPAISLTPEEVVARRAGSALVRIRSLLPANDGRSIERTLRVTVER